MITINTNVESQTASKQQEMPEVFFFLFILLASWILLPRLQYNQKLIVDQKQKVRSKRPASSHNMLNSPFLKGQNSPAQCLHCTCP